MRKLLLIGGGGHCLSVLDSVIASGLYDDIGIIDHRDSEPFLGISVIGDDDDIPRLKEEGWAEAFVTVGSVGDTAIRRRLYTMVRDYGLNVPTIIDPSATIARGCTINEGTFIGKHAVVNAGTVIGTCCIVNTGAIIEHECALGDFSHISPAAALCGRVRIGTDTHIGAGTVVRQQIVIGNNVLVGAGSVVLSDITSGEKAYGNPCRVVK